MIKKINILGGAYEACGFGAQQRGNGCGRELL